MNTRPVRENQSASFDMRSVAPEQPASAGPSSNNVSVLLNNGNGTFALAVNYAAAGAFGVAVADEDGDGAIDLAKLEQRLAEIVMPAGKIGVK